MVRILSTENKRYVKEQTVLAARWSAVGIVILGLLGFALLSWKGEIVERENPSPAEWSYVTRSSWRSAWLSQLEDLARMAQINWGNAGQHWRKCLLRLEDKEIDGKDLLDISPQGASAYQEVRGIGPVAFDASAKSEAWKAGYAEVVMKTALAAEHLQEMVVDYRQSAFFPKSTVVGPSNPKPRSVPGGGTPPQEADTGPAMPDPAVLYNRVAHGIGFSPRQRIDAMHAHANWLEFNKNTEGADEQYQYAVSVARSALPSDPVLSNTTEIAAIPNTVSVLDNRPETATSNLINTLSTQAAYMSRTSRTSEALPIFLSALRAVRHAASHPTPTSVSGSITQSTPSGPFAQWSAQYFRPDEFPLPLRTGDEPLSSLDPAALKCKEAELMTYIGEILFSTSSSRRKDGLAWTKRAADEAEKTLRSLMRISNSVPGDGAVQERERERKTGMNRKEREACRECLVMGVRNWELMASRMLESGHVKEQKKGWKSWFGREEDVQPEGDELEAAQRLKQDLIGEGLVQPWAFLRR
ncbi:hypothetical protein CAC42_4343 [Sphaceloma murrayae]|uniref:Uncharacterized protein n=1 Tax=Sphaceloma murrayae TaxID=2082308 RepID=A0A2K1QLX4_9PEZI|nr:hypothetical protein CAC42_4343 [Sphaceloma murrayae]